MSRIKNIVDAELKDQLIQHVYHRFGKKLTHSYECEKLSLDINAITDKIVAANTLRRFFGFLKSDFSPSIKTLNALAEYSGFENWHYFLETASSSINYQPLTLNQEAALYLDFYKIELKHEADMNYHNATRNIAFRILFNRPLLSKLSPPLARNPVSQVYFFERFPYIDGLGLSDYKRSIQLYLQKKTDEAQIFGSSLLFLSAFLCCKIKEMKVYHKKINQFTLTETMHPFLIARFIGSNILYALSQNESIDIWIGAIEKWNKYFFRKAKLNFWNYPYFQHMIADYLNLAGLFKESYQIIRNPRHLNKTYEMEKGYDEALEVIYEIAHHSVSTFNYTHWYLKTKVFDSINPLFQKYYELQSLCVYRSLLNGKKKEKLNKKIDQLIRQTGFIYFSRYLI